MKFTNQLLDGIEQHSESEMRSLGIVEEGLGKASKKTVYDIINEKLVEMLKKGDLPWINQRKDAPYKGQDGSLRNLITKRAYTGVNVMMLNSEVESHHGNFFVTKKQIEDKGKKLKPGAKPFAILFTKKLNISNEVPATETAPAKTEDKKIWFLRQYRVYNVADTTIVIKTKDLPKAKTEEEVIESCETIYPKMPKKPVVRHGGSNAFYTPAQDYVQMPNKGNFTTLQGYYRTLFHELSHSTGHETRLKRKFARIKDSFDYSVEELIAEISASYLCAHTGVFFANAEKHASYLDHYLKQMHGKKLAQYKADLVLIAQDDKTFLLHAIGAAQKAANFILSKQLAAKKKKGKKKAEQLSGVIKKTDIKKLKRFIAKSKNLGKSFRKIRKFDPYTLTDHAAEFLLGRRVKAESYKRFGDPKHLTGKSGNIYRLHWFGDKGIHKQRPLDQMAQDFIGEYPQFHSVDEGDVIGEMVEIITNYPNGAGAYMDDRMRQREFENDRLQDEPVKSEQGQEDDYFLIPEAVLEIESLKRQLKKQGKPVMKKTKTSTKAKKTGTRKSKIVTAKKAAQAKAPVQTSVKKSPEISDVEKFLRFDRKHDSIHSVQLLSGSIKKKIQGNIYKNHIPLLKELQGKLGSILTKQKGLKGAFIIKISPELHTKCQKVLLNTRVVMRTDYLAGAKPKPMNMDSIHWWIIDRKEYGFTGYKNGKFATKEKSLTLSQLKGFLNPFLVDKIIARNGATEKLGQCEYGIIDLKKSKKSKRIKSKN